MKTKVTNNYLPEFKAFMFGRKRPLAVSLNITDKCNQFCVYCEIGKNQSSNKTNMLNFDDLVLLVDEMNKNSIFRLSINGGEPFLFERLIEFVEYAASKNVRCSITSNGMGIYKLDNPELEVLKVCESEINISIDSFESDINNLIRGNNKATENAVKSVKKLIEYGIFPTILSAISTHNYKDIFSNIIEAQKIGVKQVLFQPIIYLSNYPDRNILKDKSRINVPKEGIDSLLLQLKKIHKYELRNSIKTNVYRLLPWVSDYLKFVDGNNKKYFWEGFLKKFECRDIYSIIDIAYDGEIQPCAFSSSGIYLSQIKKDGLLNVWKEAGKHLKSELESKQVPLFCNSCCNHFSRNMIYSAFRHPIRNHKAFLTVFGFTLQRFWFSSFYKKK